MQERIITLTQIQQESIDKPWQSNELVEEYRNDVVKRTMDALDMKPSSDGWHAARFAAGKAVELVLNDVLEDENHVQEIMSEGVS